MRPAALLRGDETELGQAKSVNCSAADCRGVATTALVLPAHGVRTISGVLGASGQLMQQAGQRAAAAGAADVTLSGAIATSAAVADSAGLGQGLLGRAAAGQLCREHGRRARRQAVGLYVVQLRVRWAQLPEAEDRVRAAEPGSAAVADVVLLQGCAQLLHEVAQVAECENDLAWKQAAAAVEERRGVLVELLASHVY